MRKDCTCWQCGEDDLNEFEMTFCPDKKEDEDAGNSICVKCAKEQGLV